MKIRISDMMDQMECTVVELQGQGSYSLQRVREKTLHKIHNIPAETHIMRKISRMGMAAAVLVLCFSATTAAGVILKWNGFANTDGLSRREKEALMEEAGTAYAGEMVNEIDGSVHYLDQYGNEIMILSAAEAAEHEMDRRNAEEQAVVESTSLVDVSLLPLIPHGITEMETTDEGRFADFMLGNGHMILFHPAGENGYSLAKGDIVTVMLNADSECHLQFRVYQDGKPVEEETSRARQHCFQFTVEEEGQYHFSVMQGSSDARMFTNGSITVE